MANTWPAEWPTVSDILQWAVPRSTVLAKVAIICSLFTSGFLHMGAINSQLSATMYLQMVAVDLQFICYLIFVNGAVNLQFYVGNWLLASRSLFITWSLTDGCYQLAVLHSNVSTCGGYQCVVHSLPFSQKMVAINLQLSVAIY